MIRKRVEEMRMFIFLKMKAFAEVALSTYLQVFSGITKGAQN